MRIGIDLGGTKTSLVALDDQGVERHRARTPTPASDYDAIVLNVRDMVLAAERALRCEGTVGIGTPGAPSRIDGRMKNANTVVLNGKPLLQDLQRALGREVRMENDANCMALSEATDGAGQGAAVVFAVILGTGVGGGLVVHGRVLTGAHAIGGEWGHNPLPWPTPGELPGPACYCGRHGCIETFLSGPGLARTHASALDAREVVARSEAGEAQAQSCMDTYEDRLARSLASVINLVDPDVVVLAGGLSNVDRLYKNVPPLLGQYVFSDVISTPIRKAAHGDDSGVRGAAWLW